MSRHAAAWEMPQAARRETEWIGEQESVRGQIWKSGKPLPSSRVDNFRRRHEEKAQFTTIPHRTGKSKQKAAKASLLNILAGWTP